MKTNSDQFRKTLYAQSAMSYEILIGMMDQEGSDSIPREVIIEMIDLCKKRMEGV